MTDRHRLDSGCLGCLGLEGQAGEAWRRGSNSKQKKHHPSIKRCRLCANHRVPAILPSIHSHKTTPTNANTTTTTTSLGASENKMRGRCSVAWGYLLTKCHATRARKRSGTTPGDWVIQADHPQERRLI